VNQYEWGQYEDAAWTLREADKLWQARFAGPEARTLAFLALALQRLDRRVEAADELARLRARYEDGATCDESYLFRAERALAEGDEQLSAVWDLMSAGRFADAWRGAQALRASATGDPTSRATALHSLAQAVARAGYRRAKTIEHLDGPPAEILQNLLMSLSADPNYVPALRDLAWLRAVCPAGEYREGGQAVAHARKACELTGWQDERCLSVLAAACAEAGDFRSAVQRQTEAIRLAGQKAPATSTDEMEARLKLYEAGRHLHTDRVHRLVAWWKLDEGTGTVCSDSSGHGHTATVMGNLQWRAGRSGGALLFNDKDYVDCGNDRAFNLPHEITIACWIQTPGFTQEHQTLVAKGDSSWRLQRLDSTNRLAFHCDGLTTTSNYYAKDCVEGKTKVDDGQWHHVAAVYDGASLQLYLDGVLDNAEVATGTIAANEQPVFIGSNGAPEFPKEWNGLIDEVRIYSRALSAVEIADLHGREATNPSAGVLNR
jgi:tetratricopeptide (TPR) repeat protein